MNLRYIPHLFLLLSLLISCKKAEIDKPLSIKETEVYSPPGYNPALIYNKKEVINVYGTINDVVVNPNNSDEVTILGGFYSIGLVNGLTISSPRIAKYKVSTNILSKYPINLNANYSYVNSIINSSNGFDYLAGSMQEMSGFSNVYLGAKTPGASFFSLNTVNLNNSVTAMKEYAGKIYFVGAFTYTVPYTAYCSPVLVFDENNLTISEFGSNSPAPIYNNTCIEIYNTKAYVAGGFNGYIGCTSGGAWSTPGGGFNNSVEDLAVFDNKLYVGGRMTSYYVSSTSLNYVNVFNEFTQSWEKVGNNNLPGLCKDIEWYNGDLYACGYDYIYKLDKSDNKWKSILSSTVNVYDARKIKFLNGKLFVIEADQSNNIGKISSLS